MNYGPPIGVISMFYARPFERKHFPAFTRMRRAGCEFVELLAPEPGELDLVETKAAIADAGLGVLLAARVNLSRDLASDDEAAHARGVSYLEDCVDMAVALNGRFVGGPLYGAPLVFAGRAPAHVDESARLRRFERVVSGLKRAARKADDEGVELALEPLNRFETDLANTTRHGLDLVEAVDSPALGLMLDTFHMNMEEADIAGAIRQAGERLVHFQANENHRGFLGTGHIDWKSVFRALADIAYLGSIALEPFRRDDERPGVPLAQWRPPTRTNKKEDADLAASVKFVRNLLNNPKARE